MDGLLNEVSTIDLRKESSLPSHYDGPEQTPKTIKISNSEDALDVLRSQPDSAQVQAVLRFLLGKASADLNIAIPSPASARIISGLITSTIVDYQGDDTAIRADLLACLRNLAGIKGIVARLRLLSSDDPKDPQKHKLSILLYTLRDILAGDDLLTQICHQLRSVEPTAKSALLYKELIKTLASGRIISIAAEARHKSSNILKDDASLWYTSGAEYSAWLGRNITSCIVKADHFEESPELETAVGILCQGIRIGYPAQMIASLYQTALNTDPILSLSRISLLLSKSSVFDQSRLLDHSSHFCTVQFKLSDIPLTTHGHPALSQAVTLLSLVVTTPHLKQALSQWMTDPVRNCIEPIALRRAVLSVLADNALLLQNILLVNGELFGDAMFVDHAPLLQQEACAQTILLSAALLHRTGPEIVRKFARSSEHTNATTKRLGASSQQARIMGMVVCMGISQLVDQEKGRMDFKVEEVRTERALAYIGLVRDPEIIQPLENLAQLSSTRTSVESIPKKLAVASRKPSMTRDRPPDRQKPRPVGGSRIIELPDDGHDDDLVPYAAPDSDPEDDDEDPTLVNRDKVRAPVYIRDLIAGLQDTENFDRHALALKTAASLIRRKAKFGKEVSDHVVELRGILVGLGDPFDIPDFAELRLQALIALFIADPEKVAPAYARQVFEGDYSLSQRATVLSAIGLGARELAGYKDVDDLNPLQHESASFPSKRLPDRLHRIWHAPETSMVQSITSQLGDEMLRPATAQALDAATGPQALKVRTFSSRMAVEKKKSEERTKRIPNQLAKIMAESIFTPLVGNWWAHTQAYRDKASSYDVHQQPFLLSTFLKTLAITLHASGPGTVSLPQLTGEFWEVLLAVRQRAVEQAVVMEAVLFGLLTCLEVNQDKRLLAEQYSRNLVETQGWVEMVYERLTSMGASTRVVDADGQGTDKEADKIKMLAMGILMQLQEVVDRYQRLLMGDLLINS